MEEASVISSFYLHKNLLMKSIVPDGEITTLMKLREHDLAAFLYRYMLSELFFLAFQRT
jgi:hypothetical protein